MKNIKLILEYDGTNYHGWQLQSGTGRPTIQEKLEQAIRALTNEAARTVSSGRTDAGVHALGHAASFVTASAIPPAAWAPALNHLLPDDIRVLSSEEVSFDFHARYSALGKIYKYRVLNRRAPSALHRNYAWHVNRRLNLAAVKRAADHLVGRHDFSAFRGAGCTAQSPVRTLKKVVVRKSGEFVEFWFEAESFLQYMVRNLTGTLVEVGLGRFRPQEVEEMLRSRDRSKAGRTAPAQGLYLVEVLYP